MTISHSFCNTNFQNHEGGKIDGSYCSPPCNILEIHSHVILTSDSIGTVTKTETFIDITFNFKTAIKMKACGLFTLVTVILGTGASPLQQIIEDPQAEKYWEAASCVYLDQWFTCDKGLVSIDNGVITCVDGLTVSS